MAATASSAFLADELEAVELAHSALEREQRRRANGGTYEAGGGPMQSIGETMMVPVVANPSATSSLMQKIPPPHRLPMLRRQMADLELATEYAAYLRQYHPQHQCREVPGRDLFGIESLTAEVESVLALSQILCRHRPRVSPRRSKRTRHDPTHQPPYTRILVEGYRPYHTRVRAKVLLEFRRCLRSTTITCASGGDEGGIGAYPAPSACRSLRDALEQSVVPEWEGGGVATELTTVTALLVRLQLYHDALMSHLRGTDENYGNDDVENGGRIAARLDAVDELIRPLVKRVHFHFADESGAGGDGTSSSSGRGRGSGGQVRMTTSNLAELPRWLFRYVQNGITGAEEDATVDKNDGDECGILGVLLDGLLPVIESEAERYRMSAQQHQGPDGTDSSDEVNGASTINCADTFLRHHPFTSPTSSCALVSYLMSAMSTLVATVFQRRDYVCSLSSRTPATAGAKALMDGIEQCLRFDIFAQELLSGESDNYTGMNDCLSNGITLKLLWKNPPVLDLWIDVERKRGMDSLADAPVLVPKSDTAAPLSPIAEAYASLITSILAKSSVLKSSIKRKFVAGIAVPLTTYIMDCMHGAASSFRDSMIRAAGRRSAEMDLEALLLNLQDWLDLICGIEMAIVALESSPLNSNASVTTVPVTLGGQDQDLLRLSQSMHKLRNAIIEEYSSTLVETVLMERSGLASYFMTAPNHLMGDAIMGDVVLSSREGRATGDMPAASKELEQPLGVLLSFLDKLCLVHSSRDKAGPAHCSPPTQRLIFTENAVTAIMTNVGNRIQEKFEELVTDPSGSIPEIQRSGAFQLLLDVQLLHGMFDSVNDVMNNTPDDNFSHTNAHSNGIFGSLVLLLRLMSADDKQIQSLRDGLFGLVADAMPHLSPGMHYIPSQPFEDDGTLHETARSMLESKGFGEIQLEDAISILNRRKVKSSSAAAALGRL